MAARIALVTTVLGALEAVLLARLVARLLAARPDNLAFAALFALSAPFRAPFAALDANQPRFGAVLELSTLAACVVLGLCLLVLAAFALTRPRSRGIA